MQMHITEHPGYNLPVDCPLWGADEIIVDKAIETGSVDYSRAYRRVIPSTLSDLEAEIRRQVVRLLESKTKRLAENLIKRRKRRGLRCGLDLSEVQAELLVMFSDYERGLAGMDETLKRLIPGLNKYRAEVIFKMQSISKIAVTGYSNPVSLNASYYVY